MGGEESRVKRREEERIRKEETIGSEVEKKDKAYSRCWKKNKGIREGGPESRTRTDGEGCTLLPGGGWP